MDKHGGSRLFYVQGTESETESEVNEDLAEEVKCGAKCDVYWLMMLRILHLANSQSFKLHKKEYIIGMVHGICVYILTIGLQLTVTAFLLLAAARTEVEYHSKFYKTTGMKLSWATGNMTEAITANKTYTGAGKQGIMDECVAQLNVRYEWIYVVMIFVWVLNMLIEFKDVTKDVSALIGIPRTTNGGSIFSEDGEQVVSLTPRARLALITVGPGVRCFVAILLLYAGCQVLLFRQSTMLVLLCSMSLAFVITLDELMLKALSEAGTKKELESLKLVYTKHHTPIHKYWIGGLSGLTHMLLCILLAVFYVYGMESCVMTFRETCWDYYLNFGKEELEPANNMMTFSEMFAILESDVLKVLIYK